MSKTYGTEEWEKSYLEMVDKRTGEEESPFMLGTPEWISELEKSVKEDAAYKDAGKDWEGSLTIHIMAKPEISLDEDIYILMDLWHGDCRSMRLVPAEAGLSATYVLSGPYDNWKPVITGELDTVKEMMRGKLKLKGDLASVVRNVGSAKRMVELVCSNETRFPDELSPDEQQRYRSVFKELQEEFGI